ncbi:MAG TPA: NAD(P)-dependent glycerol-3-phosphate dehydrogenase [Planctomycetes bacterium]|nr:NAD(P)-dependent glycerol-3-phosphate dehydrogenase [Planctomycetota bacterium]
MFEKITIIGDGAMGSICAMLLCEKGLSVTMWGYDAEQLAQIEAARQNVRFLPGHKLPEKLLFESRDDKAFAGAGLVVSAVPCQFMRGIWKRLKSYAPPDIPFVSVTKGIENTTLLRPSEILTDVLGPAHDIAVLSGPTIADEVADKMPATASVASTDDELAEKVQTAFATPYFRVYTNDDILGVELAGAVKNVIAIAAGVIDGVRAGDNAKAALVSRGLAEIKRLGLAMGAKESTFAGLSGLGDLVTTCISPKGRNRSFGERIGRGLSTAEALKATDSVVEGVATAESVLALAKRYNIEMPITEAVHAVIVEDKSVQTAIHDLMTRQLKAE